MTVKDLTEILQTMPQDCRVQCECTEWAQDIYDVELFQQGQTIDKHGKEAPGYYTRPENDDEPIVYLR